MAVVTGHPRPDASIINFTREPFRSPADIALATISPMRILILATLIATATRAPPKPPFIAF